MRPGRSSRATRSHVARVSCRSPLPSAPSTSASGACSGASPRSISPVLSRPTRRYPRSRSASSAREILHRDDGHVFERAGGGFRQHAGRLRTVPCRRDHRRHREARRRAQDRADIVRVGDLVEHEHDPGGFELVELGRGQGVGFRQQSVVHGVRPEPVRDRVRSYQFGLDPGRQAVFGQAACGVLGGEQPPDPPRRIFQRCLHRVPAVQYDRAVAGPRLGAARRAISLGLAFPAGLARRGSADGCRAGVGRVGAWKVLLSTPHSRAGGARSSRWSTRRGARCRRSRRPVQKPARSAARFAAWPEPFWRG